MTEPFFNLFEAAKRIGESVALEDALFSLYGTLATSAEPPELSVLLHVASRSHGELSRAFSERLPVSASIPTEQFRGVSSPLGATAMAAVASVDIPRDPPAAYLEVITAEIIPAVRAAHFDAFSLTAAHADGPFRVILDRALEVLDGDLELFDRSRISL